MVISPGISESAGKKSRSFPTEPSQRSCKTAEWLQSAEHNGSDRTHAILGEGRPGWAPGVEHRPQRLLPRRPATRLWKTEGADPYIRPWLYRFPKQKVYSGQMSYMLKPTTIKLPEISPEVQSVNYPRAEAPVPTSTPAQGCTHSHRTPCLNKDNRSPTRLSRSRLFIHAYICCLRPQKRNILTLGKISKKRRLFWRTVLPRTQ